MTYLELTTALSLALLTVMIPTLLVHMWSKQNRKCRRKVRKATRQDWWQTLTLAEKQRLMHKEELYNE